MQSNDTSKYTNDTEANNQKMQMYFQNMTETATMLKRYLSSNVTNQTDSDEFKANVTFYS